MITILPSQNAVEQIESAAQVRPVSPSGNMPRNAAEFWDHTACLGVPVRRPIPLDVAGACRMLFYCFAIRNIPPMIRATPHSL